MFIYIYYISFTSPHSPRRNNFKMIVSNTAISCSTIAPPFLGILRHISTISPHKQKCPWPSTPRIHSGPKVHCTGSNACRAWSIWLALALSVSCSCRKKSWPKINETLGKSVPHPHPAPPLKKNGWLFCANSLYIVPKHELKAHFRGDSVTKPVLNPFWSADQSGWNVGFKCF